MTKRSTRIRVHPDFKRALKRMAIEEDPDMSLIDYTERISGKIKRKKREEDFNVFW